MNYWNLAGIVADCVLLEGQKGLRATTTFCSEASVVAMTTRRASIVNH